MEIELGKFSLHRQKRVNPDQLGLGSSGVGDIPLFCLGKVVCVFKTELCELISPVFQLACIGKRAYCSFMEHFAKNHIILLEGQGKSYHKLIIT